MNDQKIVSNDEMTQVTVNSALSFFLYEWFDED